MKRHFITHRGFYLFLLLLGCVAFVVYIGLRNKGYFDPVPVESVDYKSMIDTAPVRVLADQQLLGSRSLRSGLETVATLRSSFTNSI